MGNKDTMSVEDHPCIDKLVDIGLNKYEALAYLTLLEKNNATATGIAKRSGVPKQRIYDVLDNLQTKGLCAVQGGRPRSYLAYPPQQALPALLAYRKQQQAAENERQSRLITELIPELTVMVNGKNSETSLSISNDASVNDYRDIGGF